MNILVTAGNTQTPIDRVRCLTNIFTGRTGARIALAAQARGHNVSLLTSHIDELMQTQNQDDLPWSIERFTTFDDLRALMEKAVRSENLDAIIHSAAVSDYQAGGIFAPAPGSRFEATDATWQSAPGCLPALVDRAAGKVKSDEPELWLRLVRTVKLVDCLRRDWGFRGVLVKFKLEVGLDEQQLEAVAERSRRQSQADLMVANTLEGKDSWALLGPVGGKYLRIAREELACQVLDRVEQLGK